MKWRCETRSETWKPRIRIQSNSFEIQNTVEKYTCIVSESLFYHMATDSLRPTEHRYQC